MYPAGLGKHLDFDLVCPTISLDTGALAFRHLDSAAMNRKKWLLVTDELVELEK